MFYQFFLLPQGKQWAIITYKHGIYELPHELPNCAPFTNCMRQINNTNVDDAKDLDIVMPMYDLIEYSDNYSKTS